MNWRSPDAKKGDKVYQPCRREQCVDLNGDHAQISKEILLDADPLAAGFEAIAAGYSLRYPDDYENIERQFEVYGALYAWCRLDVARAHK